MESLQTEFLSSDSDWERILKLRLHAYHSVGKMMDRLDHWEMEDRFDAFSRHIVASVGEKVVGSARVVLVGKDLEKSEHHSIGLKIPDYIVEHGFVEFSRFCVHADFRGSDIFVALMRKGGYLSFLSKHRYIIANCNPDLWPVYKSIGFRKIGEPFEAFGRSDCMLISLDLRLNNINSLRTNFFAFNQIVYVPYEQHIQKLGINKNDFWLTVHRFLHPTINRLLTKKAYRKYKKTRKHLTFKENIDER